MSEAMHGDFDRLRSALVALEFLAEGATANFDPKINEGKAGDRILASRGHTLYDKYALKLAELADQAEVDLERFAKSRRPPEDQQKAYREHVVKQHQGTHYEDAAMVEKVSGSYIRQVRAEAGRDQTWGTEKGTNGRSQKRQGKRAA